MQKKDGTWSTDGAERPGLPRGPATRGRPRKVGKIDKAVATKIDRYFSRGNAKSVSDLGGNAFAKSDRIPHFPIGESRESAGGKMTVQMTASE